MEEGDEARSGRPLRSPPAALPAAAAALMKAAALSSGGGSGGGGSGREDCWSEGATAALVEAWGERFLELGRGNLRQHHWQEVADVVSARDDYAKPPKSQAQCKNRVDTLKKKYKLEKARRASSWPLFPRLHHLLSSPSSSPARPGPAPSAFPRAPPFPVAPRSFHHFRKKKAWREEGDRGLAELTRAIRAFGEVYERVERSKITQAVEMERQRMGFAKELELQRMQFYVKTQLELTRLKRDGSSD
ncbi:sequence-specific DNA binding transcription factor [Wolffia australiana]